MGRIIQGFLKKQAAQYSRIEFTREEIREIYYYPFIENYFSMFGGFRKGIPPTFEEWLLESQWQELENGHFVTKAKHIE